MKTAVFVCFTPYQLLNAVYYGKKLDKKVKRVLIWHNYTKYKIDLNRFKASFDNICAVSNFYEEPFIKRQYHKCLYGGWLFRFSKINILLSKFKEDAVLFVFSDQHIVTNKILTVYGQKAKDVILTEEGLGTYLIRRRDIPKTKDWFINLFLGAKYEPFIGANRFIKTVFVKKPWMLPDEKKHNRTVVQQNNVFCDEMWKDLFRDVLSDGISAEKSKKKVILWLGQPIEMDGVSADIQIEWLRKMESALPEDYQIIIKPHPREVENKYDILTADTNIKQLRLKDFNWIPIEILVSLIQPDVALSAYSTAAINIIELGIKCKAVYCYPAFKLSIDDNVSELFKKSANVYCVNNLLELNNVLSLETDTKNIDAFNNKDADIDYLMKHISEQ